jgi:hypothetical protein
MEAKRKYEKPVFRFMTELENILECLYEVYGSDGVLLLVGERLSNTIIYPFLRMIEKKCKILDAESLHTMLWKIYMVSSAKEAFVSAAKIVLQPYLEDNNGR